MKITYEFVTGEDYAPFFNGEKDFFMEDLKDGLEVQSTKEQKGSPSWRVQVEYTNHTEQDICSYEDYLPDRPEKLYLSLLEYFEPEDGGLLMGKAEYGKNLI